jgi:hypothetical protein
MSSAKTTKLFRDREGDQEMSARQTLLQLCLEPLTAFMILTLRAMAVSARPIDEVLFAAALASIDGGAKATGTAVDDSSKGLLMDKRHIRVESQILGAEGAKDLGNRHDCTSAMTVLMI